MPLFVGRQAATGLRKFARVGQMPRAFLRISQVEAQGILWKQPVEQSGFSRLACSKQEVDVRPTQLRLEFTGRLSIKHRL